MPGKTVRPDSPSGGGPPGAAAGTPRDLAAPPLRRGPWPRLLLAAAGVALLLLAGRAAGAQLPAFARWVDGLGAWGPLAFIAGYAAATVAFVPGSILTLAAGAIFGLARGTAFVLIAATLGASGAFLVSRHLARRAIESRIAGDARFAAIDRAIGAQGWKIVFLLRLSPIVPFNLLNYALGLTRVRFLDYVVASAGMLPGTLLYVYYGKIAGDVAALAGGVSAGKGAADYAVLALGLAATVAATALVTRAARSALREATEGAAASDRREDRRGKRESARGRGDG